jgi:hypothetical protein
MQRCTHLQHTREDFDICPEREILAGYLCEMILGDGCDTEQSNLCYQRIRVPKSSFTDPPQPLWPAAAGRVTSPPVSRRQDK